MAAFDGKVAFMTAAPCGSPPIPILCGGQSEAALRRAAQLYDGWVGYTYAWDAPVSHVQKLDEPRAFPAVRRGHHRQSALSVGAEAWAPEGEREDRSEWEARHGHGR